MSCRDNIKSTCHTDFSVMSCLCVWSLCDELISYILLCGVIVHGTDFQMIAWDN